jgi:hypothetical protein
VIVPPRGFRERGPPGEELVNDAAQGPVVNAFVVANAEQHLGGTVLHLIVVVNGVEWLVMLSWWWWWW